MSLAEAVFDLLRQASPLIVVRTQQAGVDWRCGHVQPRALGPGVYVRLPYLREIGIVSRAVQWVDMPVQGLVTADDRTVALSANYAYRVVDPVRWAVATADAEHAITNALRPEIAAIVAERDYETLRDRLPALGRLIRARSRAVLERIGAVPLAVGVSDFVPARHYRLLNDTLVS